MKIEDQVTSLELSKRLKELGVKQESLFYWSASDEFSDYEIKRKDEHPVLQAFTSTPRWREDIYSAYTASELFDYIYSVTKASFFIYHNAGNYLLQYGMSQGNYEDPNLVNCLAMYILDQKIT